MGLPTPVFDGVIDVSHNNGAIDWKAVAGAGIALAFLKASEGTGFTDPLFVRNQGAARAEGLMVVPYHFVDAGDDPISQARFF
jgi:lysozyme